jgi:hypothetical protein
MSKEDKELYNIIKEKIKDKEMTDEIRHLHNIKNILQKLINGRQIDLQELSKLKEFLIKIEKEGL